MGTTNYSSDSRSLRSKKFAVDNKVEFLEGAKGAFLNMADTKTFNTAFVQNQKREVHPEMNPKGLKFRESRDSTVHPKTVPIIVGLDVTGSMGRVPKDFVMEGLPTMMSTIIQRGTPDAAVCFMAIGDHVHDRGPIQVGQFESGDAELDMWLTRTWIEEGGGGNDGESYMLPWYVAARHTKLDSCEKRNTKGFLFTVGDEPCLPSIPANALREIFGDSEGVQGDLNSEDILREAQKCYDVYHIALSHRGEAFWKKLLGQNYILCDDYTKIPKMVAEIVASYNSPTEVTTSPVTGDTNTPIIL